jgi:ParB-like chromosome segregation protein Spo0J
MGRRNDTSKVDALLASVTEDMLGEGLPQTLVDNSVRVERILLEMLRPDPVQARRVLPETLHMKFHNNRLTPTQALRELVQIAQVSARQQARPFANVLELLADSESDAEQAEKLSPEEDSLRELVNLAVTIRDDGQVNPLTVVDVSQGVTRLYRIETGERRYWAHWLLRDFVEGYEGDGMVDCIIVPAETSSVFRQAKENIARKGLGAIAMARQAALLLLTVHGYEIPNHAVNNDFYRQALELDLRGKREYTESILSAMGGVTKQRLNQYKQLLMLSDEAWELADRYSLDERVLRSIIELPHEAQAEMVQQVIQMGLTSKQVEAIVSNTGTDEVVIVSGASKFARTVLKEIEKQKPADFAKAIVQQQGDIHLAFAYLNRFEEFINQSKASLSDEQKGQPGLTN